MGSAPSVAGNLILKILLCDSGFMFGLVVVLHNTFRTLGHFPDVSDAGKESKHL